VASQFKRAHHGPSPAPFLCRGFERLTARVRLRLLADPTDEHGHYVSDVLLLFERQIRPHPWRPGRRQAYGARRSASSGGQEHWAPPSRGARGVWRELSVLNRPYNADAVVLRIARTVVDSGIIDQVVRLGSEAVRIHLQIPVEPDLDDGQPPACLIYR
jgi:hypothetical protein